MKIYGHRSGDSNAHDIYQRIHEVYQLRKRSKETSTDLAFCTEEPEPFHLLRVCMKHARVHLKRHVLSYSLTSHPHQSFHFILFYFIFLSFPNSFFYLDSKKTPTLAISRPASNKNGEKGFNFTHLFLLLSFASSSRFAYTGECKAFRR